MAASGNHVNGDNVPKLFGNFGFTLPWGHPSLWFRNAAGVAIGEVDDEFANLYFGGFGDQLGGSPDEFMLSLKVL